MTMISNGDGGTITFLYSWQQTTCPGLVDGGVFFFGLGLTLFYRKTMNWAMASGLGASHIDMTLRHLN